MNLKKYIVFGLVIFAISCGGGGGSSSSSSTEEITNDGLTTKDTSVDQPTHHSIDQQALSINQVEIDANELFEIEPSIKNLGANQLIPVLRVDGVQADFDGEVTKNWMIVTPIELQPGTYKAHLYIYALEVVEIKNNSNLRSLSINEYPPQDDKAEALVQLDFELIVPEAQEIPKTDEFINVDYSVRQLLVNQQQIEIFIEPNLKERITSIIETLCNFISTPKNQQKEEYDVLYDDVCRDRV